MSNLPILSTLIYTPLVGALILLFIRNNDEKNNKLVFNITLLFTTITFLISLYAGYEYYSHFTLNNFNYLAESNYIKSFTFLEYYTSSTPIFGVDGISLLLIILTTFLMPACILTSKHVQNRLNLFMICFLVLESVIIAVFSSLHMLLFYILFEASLIPMFLIIGIWGGDNRIYAAFKFFLYTFLGSVLFLVSIIFLYTKFGSFDYFTLTSKSISLDLEIQKWLWLAMFASFAVKVPMFPVHTWLPDAHVQAPTAGSVILAGVLLKLGGYGLIRFSIPMLPAASMYFSELVSILSMIAIIYASFVAFAQKDMKKMIAYSSVAHMGYVTIGLFSNLDNIYRFTKPNLAVINDFAHIANAFNYNGVYGSIFQMISHGVVSAALFLVVGSLYERMHTKEIAAYGGVAEKMPKLALFFMIFMLASVGLPGTSGFIGEFLVTLSVFDNYNYVYAFFVGLGVIVGAMYMLVLYAKVMFGEIKNQEVNHLHDLTKTEVSFFAPLAIITLVLGFYPSLVNDALIVPVNVMSQDLISSSYKPEPKTLPAEPVMETKKELLSSEEAKHVEEKHANEEDKNKPQPENNSEIADEYKNKNVIEKLADEARPIYQDDFSKDKENKDNSNKH